MKTIRSVCAGAILLTLCLGGCQPMEHPKLGEELYMSTYAWFSTRVDDSVRDYRLRNGKWPTTMTQAFGPGPWRTQPGKMQAYLKEGDLRFELKSPPEDIAAVYEIQYPHYDAFKIEVHAYDPEMESAEEGVRASVGLGLDAAWPAARGD
ncbi:MAG: hypothetical protein JST35_11285 [Armatimonadetes bacterium]|nr:hypothetical protein [Armatimonadota bacterium]